MLMLESIKVRNKLNGDHRRYSLAEMVSESYRVLYSCKRGTPLYKLVEAHINDVRENPSELEKLSENLHLLKQAAKLGSKVRINEDEIAQTKPDKTLTDESKTEDVEQEEGPDVIDEADERFQAKKSLLPTVDEIELKEKACKESIKKAFGKKSVKESEIIVSTPDATVAIETDGEEEDDYVEPEAVVPAEEPVVYESKSRSYRNCKKGLKNFCESSKSKAFYKTFKRMSESLKDSKKEFSLTESISLYKAANSAMTQLAIELEHNPGFLKTFTECTSLLSRDTRNLLTCIKTKRSPSRNILESLSSFSNVLLEEDEQDYDDDVTVTSPEATPVEETPAEEEEVAPEEAIADAIEAEIPEEVAEEIQQEVETAEEPAEAVAEVIEDLTDEEAEDLLKYLYVMRQTEGETEEYADAEVPEDFEAGDLTDDELAELASHLKESRRMKRFKEARARHKQMKEALKPMSQDARYGYDVADLPSGDAPMMGTSKDGNVDVIVSGDTSAPSELYVAVIYEDGEAQRDYTDQDTALRVANGILNSYDSGKDLEQILNSYKFRIF